MENELLTNKNVLFLIEDDIKNKDDEYYYIKDNFCGIVYTDVQQINNYNNYEYEIYYAGDLSTKHFEHLHFNNNVYCIEKYCEYVYSLVRTSYLFFNEWKEITYVTIGQIPINIHNVGVLFRKYFTQYRKMDFFTDINDSHKFQNLTESNKGGQAFRTGIYLTNVNDTDDGKKFNLLRCSSNLHGPTDNFKDVDNHIIDTVNNIAHYYFKEPVELNHVLAQIYHNQIINNKEKKAKIKEHSDKTKDMDKDAVMAFCTFYKKYYFDDFNEEHLKGDIKKDHFDYIYNKGSILSTLRFRLKKCVNNPYLVKTFDVKLYPNSIFMMSLKTNRLYTHEIIPPSMPIDKIPTRMGYVIRCSSTPAIHRNGKTYIVKNNNEIELVKGSDEDIKAVKDLYYKENTTDEMVYYKDIHFSMNDGDYLEPTL